MLSCFVNEQGMLERVPMSCRDSSARENSEGCKPRMSDKAVPPQRAHPRPRLLPPVSPNSRGPRGSPPRSGASLFLCSGTLISASGAASKPWLVCLRAPQAGPHDAWGRQATARGPRWRAERLVAALRFCSLSQTSCTYHHLRSYWGRLPGRAQERTHIIQSTIECPLVGAEHSPKQPVLGGRAQSSVMLHRRQKSTTKNEAPLRPLRVGRPFFSTGTEVGWPRAPAPLAAHPSLAC